MPGKYLSGKSFSEFQQLLVDHDILLRGKPPLFRLSRKERQLDVFIKGEQALATNASHILVLHEDQLYTSPKKVLALLLSKLGANQVIFARKCEVRKTERADAEKFLNTYHLMNATQSAYNLGLYQGDDLLALASFSKGRKMNRLPEHQRSFELIRFCCKPGLTIAGGLTRLLKTFCKQKSAGDIMTYVDLELSNGASFLKAGFKKHSVTAPNYFLVNRQSYQRLACAPQQPYDPKKEYLDHTSGNLKLIYLPNDIT